MIEVNGGSHSGSGSIVRTAVAYAAITGETVHVVNARQRRARPGLRRQHACAVEAVRQLVGGTLEGVHIGAREFWFRPGHETPTGSHSFDVGSAGSATVLMAGLLPVLVGARGPVCVDVRGGTFQDRAPSYFHLEHALLPLLQMMGFDAELQLIRPGYVPSGGGLLRVIVRPSDRLKRVVCEQAGAPTRVWGISLASHLRERSVARRMADGAREVLAASGVSARIEERDDEASTQPGASISLFADLSGGFRLGSDRAGAPHRRAERVGRDAARQLLEDLATGAGVDRYTADMVIPFLALAAGESRLRIARETDHVTTGVWLARLFLGVSATVRAGTLVVGGREMP